MPLYRASLQTLGAIVLLALGLACHGKSGSGQPAGTAYLAGTVTYTRVPLVKDAQGVPTGLADENLADKLLTLPAQGVFVRIYQQVDQTQPDGTIKSLWIIAQSSVTDSTGLYTATVTINRPTMVEVLSTFSGGNSTVVHLVADPQGINSSVPVIDRLQYAQRKAADGSAPANINTPSSMLTANSVVNFTLGLKDEWWLVNPSYKLSTGEAVAVDQAVLETSIPGRTPGVGTGSRILGIGDTIASFVTTYGSATPGATLDLHYWPGRREPKGSYIEYDQSAFPVAYDATTGRFHCFGSLSGGPSNDDAWDEGVLLPLLARGVLYAGNIGRTFSVPLNTLFPQGAALPDLSPDMARIEGLAEAMAANVLKSPYLADTQGTALAFPVRDIRDITALSSSQKSPYSAPALRAFAWELILKANSLTSPGVASDWAAINSLSAARFFVAPSGLTGVGTNGLARDLEPLNIYSQLTRLKEAKSTAEPVDLSSIFTDQVLTTLSAPFGITWPRPTTGTFASFAADWGTDPTGSFPVVVLSMAKAIQVNGAYPNLSQGELFYGGFNLSADKRCILSTTISPALPTGTQGARIEVDLPMMARTFSFTGSGGSTEVLVIPVGNTAPFYHPVRIWLRSPTTLQPDVTVTVTLTPSL